MLETLHAKLASNLTTKILLPKARLIEESSRGSAAFNDPTYFPFYYHIGTQLSVESVFEIGFRLGLVAASFLRGCPTVKRYYGFQELSDEFYSPRMGRANVREVFQGELEVYVGTDNLNSKLCTRQWNLGILSEEVGPEKLRVYLDDMWKNLSPEGLIIVDYIDMDDSVRRIFCDFCLTKNREPSFFKSRYGLGIVKR